MANIRNKRDHGKDSEKVRQLCSLNLCNVAIKLEHTIPVLENLIFDYLMLKK